MLTKLHSSSASYLHLKHFMHYVVMFQ